MKRLLNRSRIGASVFLALMLTPALLLADQSPWGPVVGEAASVRLEQNFDGTRSSTITASVTVREGTEAVAATVTTLGVTGSLSEVETYSPPSDTETFLLSSSCTGSSEQYCNWLAFPKTGPTLCSWAALSTWTQTAINFVLGSCAKTCNAFLASGFIVSGEVWQCAFPPSECLQLTGTFTPDRRVDIIEHGSGCL